MFDYDGVVADSELLNNAILVDLLTEIGMPMTLDEALSAYVGKRWLDCLALIEARFGPCPDGLQEEWTRRCHARAPLELAPVPGALDFMRSRDERRCIASSSPLDWIHMGLNRFGLASTFGGPIYSATAHVTRGKPHPDLFLHAAAEMQADPARTLVIEDSLSGVMAGATAGMTVVGLCAGGHMRDGDGDRLRHAGAHHVVDDYAAISTILDA
ncbi:HAD family hydrolase [Brevundimonas sp. NPDC090276]|uniref:HAD family hydrolase n=1 Tax=Brevundimonas sp. NPDC090276 TaxID=3363956 RepID=UPI00383AFE4A